MLKTLLCCIGKRENQYIRDFIEYYKRLGFTHIVICDNNFNSDEYFEQVLQDYLSDNFVTIENYRDKIYPQMRAYTEIFEKYHNDYDWIAFFDIDEFLELPQDNDINSYLSKSKFEPFHAIHINWKVFTDGGQIYNDGRPVYERFHDVVKDDAKYPNGLVINYHVKSIVRGGATLQNVTDPHNISILEKVCNSDGKELTKVEATNDDYTYDEAYLKHYNTKTVSEYVNKIDRGNCDIRRTIKDMEDIFFSVNERTKEKESVFNEFFKHNEKIVEVIYVATGGYKQFAPKFMETLKYFMPNCKKIVRIISDGLDEYAHYKDDSILYTEVNHIMDLFYPCINLHKTKFIEQLTPMTSDYAFYFDADTYFMDNPHVDWGEFVKDIEEGRFIMSIHPFYCVNNEIPKKAGYIDNFFRCMTERDETQASYIKDEVYDYVISSFFGGKKEVLLKVCGIINDMIKQDMTRYNGYRIPAYADENYFNRLIVDCKHGTEKRIMVKIGAYILMANMDNGSYIESFMYQKNFMMNFKDNRQ